ncbi:MAG: LptA/OstA family protein [Desulfurobacteriaceae bacterium]
MNFNFLITVFFFLFLSFPLKAEVSDNGTIHLPVVVEAQKLTYYKKKHLAIYVGNVIAQRGETIMKGDKLLVYFDKTDKFIKKIEIIGNVYIKDSRGEGSCEKLYYYPLEGKAVLIGNAKLQQGKNIVIGDKIIAYKDGRVLVEGIKQKVKTVIFPDDKNKRALPNGKSN